VPGRAILGVSTSHLLRQGELAMGAFAHYGDDPLTLVAPEDRREVLERFIDRRVTLELTGAIGIVDWLEIGVGFPVVPSQAGGDLGGVGRPGESVEGVSIGDLRLVPKVTVLGGADGLGLHVAVAAYLPTGDAEQYAGDGGFRVRPMLGVDYAAGALRIAVNAGYEIRPERKAGTYVSDDMIRWGIGGRVVATRLLAFVASVQGTVQTAEGIDPDDPREALEDAPNVSVEALAGIEVALAGGLVLTGGAGASLVHAVGSPDVRAFFGVGWVPPVGPREAGEGDEDKDELEDEDADGIVGAADRCPDAAEDKDGFEDDDGCPDRDNDGDGLADRKDKCPNEPEDKDGDRDQDGCPDGDAVVDEDGDGIVGAADRCPGEAEDKDGFEDGDGCVDPDNDGDGLVDVADKCPNEPEDRDGFEDADGCPDPDNDGDGVADGADKCPDRPEVVNGVDDDDGCPDTDDKDVALTEREIRILKRVNFPRDSARIARDSFAILDSVAKVMREHAYLTKVRVEGHTDSEGADAVNLELSRERAAAVKAYLVERGVPEARLVSEGYGETRPLMKNDTPQGRAKNRRVEFRILEVNGAALPEEPAPALP